MIFLLVEFTSQTNYTDLQANYFDSNHIYQIRLLEQPLYCDWVGDITRPLNLTHQALAFIDLNESKQFVYHYEQNQDYVMKVRDFFRPREIYNMTTGLYDFIWDLKVSVQVMDEIKTDKCGWEVQTVVASGVKGLILNDWSHNYAQWFNDNYQTYSLFEIWSVSNKSRYEDLKANQCHDFAWWSMQNLQNQYGVQFNGKLAHRLYVHYQLQNSKKAPRRLNPQQAEDNKIIFDFYNYLQIPNYISEIVNYVPQENVDRQFVNYLNNEYWVFDTEAMPLITYTHKYIQVPGYE
ncbi:Conserved_hypothetical protein [Hexamita inflata]|uniref:Uncharacterized protein n=1 Tax=Hexamita inflata TaxID=28002 RepID=A0AA86PWW2_9EUKA|nr:Conserved hypothetical protein [Hexamita inflata]